MHGGEGDRADLRFSRVGMRIFGWGPPGCLLCVWWPRFQQCFILIFPRNPFRGCWGFEDTLFKPCRLLGSDTYRLLRSIRERLKRGLGFGWSRGSLDDIPLLDDVSRSLSQFHLLSTGTGPLNFRSGRLNCGDALSAAFGRFLCIGCLRFLPLYTATAYAVWFPRNLSTVAARRCIATTGEVETPTSEAPGSVSAVTLRWGRNSDHAYNAAGLLDQYTIPPSLGSRRFLWATYVSQLRHSRL